MEFEEFYQKAEKYVMQRDAIPNDEIVPLKFFEKKPASVSPIVLTLGRLAEIAIRREQGTDKLSVLIDRIYKIAQSGGNWEEVGVLLNTQLKVAVVYKIFIGPTLEESISMIRYEYKQLEALQKGLELT